VILILASEFDQEARAIAKQRDAFIVTPADLSKPGWRYELPGRGNDLIVASGQKIAARDITEVLNRLSYLEPRDLNGIAHDDRPYVAAEMNAFLVALLDSLNPPAQVAPVRTRPSPTGSHILLWGLPADRPLSRVHEELRRLNAPVWLLDQRDVLDTKVCGRQVHVRGESFSLDEVKSVYLRCYDSTQLPHVLERSEEARRYAAEVDAAITRWLETTAAFLVSPFDAMSANDSKPYQLRAIAEFGWRIPATLITTDPHAARDFWKRHGDVIYKSISGIRSRVSRLSPGHESRLEDVTSCPTQFQEFIPGTDYRVHVVGRDAFACQVLSQGDDYRYTEAEYIACQLPLEIEKRCCRMSAAMRLPVSGIDLRQTPDGDWVCFEVNPSPGFTAYEDITGQPIAAAIARLLVDPT
jgi:glutathione synthase/RimK-type ligase-like ATP-grasp enzyme